MINVIKIVTHNGTEFFCETKKELDIFLKNYQDHGRKLGQEIGSQFLVDHFENIKISREEYYKLGASKYFIKTNND